MSILDDLLKHFEVLNVQVELAVVEKCEKLCENYNLDPDDFIDEWLAYSASKSYGLAPTLDALDKLERYELKKTKTAVEVTPHAIKIDPVVTPVCTPIRQNLQKEFEASEGSSHSESFSKRVDAGNVLLEVGKFSNTNLCKRNLCIKLGNSELEKCDYLYQKFLAKRAVLNDITKKVISEIRNFYKLELTTEKLENYSGEMTICGRIYSEHFGKLDSNSIRLDGTIELYKGHQIKLSIKELQKTRLFSGQSIVVTGTNIKDCLTAKEIYIGAPIPPPPKPDLQETVQMMVAAGPFTVSDNLRYEPLEQLLNNVLETKPNILILMGPFLEDSHLDQLNERFDLFFENIIDGIMQRLESIQTQVVLVPSPRDVTSSIIFPTHPYILKQRYPNLHLSSNPFFLDLEGFIISGTTVDVLFHLGKIEFSQGSYSDRLEQFINHLFYQRSFYPIHPPDPALNVDYLLLEQFAMFEKSPHVMILPSTFKHFVKTIGNCVVINPERLTKGNGAGTYATLEINCEKVACTIQRI